MFPNFYKSFSFTVIVGSTLFLFGCSANMSSQYGSEDHELNNSNDPELQLIANEQEAGLDQELAALSQTGQWGDSTTFISEGDGTDKASPYNFPIVMNKQVAMYLDLFQNKQHKQFRDWMARSGKYMVLMETTLDKSGLPTDLMYLPMIESGYSQRAYSRARAVGLWQFMLPTARAYDLTIDKYVDERRDALKSTEAATKFLNDLYQDFGDWHLAVAAYNAGPGKIRKGLKKYNVDNFWDLAKYDYLHLETKRYVPKLVAAIIIARQPEKYGFSKFSLDKPIAYDTLKVKPGMSLNAISIIADTDTATIKELNQELHLGQTPANRADYAVKIPKGTKELASKNMGRLHSYVSTGYKTHTTRKGETLAAICKKYNLNTTTLLKVNNIHSSRLKSGTKLRIPYSTVKYQLLAQGGQPLLARQQEHLILHQIKKGDTVSTIAKKYRVPTKMIVDWNGLKSVNKIRTGQQIALFIENAGKTQKSSATKLIVASTSKLLKKEAPASQNVATLSGTIPTLKSVSMKLLKEPNSTNTDKISTQYSWYSVQRGDSLWEISRKFKTSAKKIKELNNLDSDLLQPGSQLKMKKV